MTEEGIAWSVAILAALGLAWLLGLATRRWGRWRYLPGCLVLALALTPFRFDGEHQAPAFSVAIFRTFLEEGLDPDPPLVALGAVVLGVAVVYVAVVGVVALVGSRLLERP